MKKMLLSVTLILVFIGYVILGKKNAGVLLPVSHSPTPTTIQGSQQYKDGEFIGKVADAFYGDLQVQAHIQNGKLTDVLFLKYPHDRPTSIHINEDAIPVLKQEAIQSQSAHVDIISGATDSARAFTESLADALSKARL